MRARETNILEFISGYNKVFIIPPFQRNYEWSFEQCDELFKDIINCHKTRKNHYLGNIVYYVGRNNSASYTEHILVDGQQRITTILLLLCALRDELEKNQFSDKDINRMYLINERGEERFRIKLKQTAYDAENFNSIVCKLPIIDDKNSNIRKNYYHFIDLIKESNIDINEIYETMQRLEIVDVNLQIENDLSTVQTVFEKINSTGKKLTAADLIRNYLLLASSSEKQEELYNNYWTKIEQTLKSENTSENISRFSRDYLIMNIFEDVPEDKIYKMFKENFEEEKIQHINILEEMCKYSRFFSWLKFENCPNEKINKYIEILNLLKTDDLYPLYLFLFEKLYNDNVKELEKILNLISDFMLRYRIVAPSGGGGALRSVIHKLLEGLSLENIKLSYNNIYFELSNSATPTGRYPNDEEFKEKLMEAVNITYARVLLIKIEEAETSNIPVPLKRVTIEHLMPQTLTTWWNEYLGGKEEAKRIFDKYIDCIGNLTPISQGYNSKNSNKPWYEKVKYLKEVQFLITSEISNTSDWKEVDINRRNEDIANRACKVITPPLKRTREYESKKVSNEFEPGIYPMSDTNTPMRGTHPNAIIYDNREYSIFNWKDVLPTICNILSEYDKTLFEEVVFTNKIHKANSTRNEYGKDPIISGDKSKLVSPIEIKGTKYFVEGSISSDRARYYTKQLIDIFDLTDFFQISVSYSDNK